MTTGHRAPIGGYSRGSPHQRLLQIVTDCTAKGMPVATLPG